MAQRGRGRKPTLEEKERLIDAIERSDQTTLRSLIVDNSIDINASIDLPFAKLGVTALHLAVVNNKLNIIQLLVELGADITVKDNSGRTPLRWAADKNHIDVVYYFIRSCKQNISQFSQEDQARINHMVAEYERAHPEVVRMQSSQVERKVQVGVKELQIRDHQDHQLLQQIQQVVAQLQATVTAEQQKTVSLERRCQELEYNNQLLQSQNQSMTSQIRSMTSQNQSIQTSLSAEQQKTNGLLERIKTLEDTVERLWAISREEIQLSNNILGTGGWGYVKEATFRGRRVAAKCLHEAIVSPHNQDLFAKEMKISARCRHKNLVEFIGAVPDHPAIIVIEMMDCTLRLALTNGRATPNHIHPICIDVAQGLVYLHGVQPNPIIHRDVSAPNVLLKAVATGWIAKLSDLGSAQFANIAQTLAPGCVLYAAPEVQQRDSARHQTVKMDVFSFGVLLIEMLTREMPTGTIAELITTIRPLWPRFVPLIQRCTNGNPNNRPSMREVITTLNTIVM